MAADGTEAVAEVVAGVVTAGWVAARLVDGADGPWAVEEQAAVASNTATAVTGPRARHPRGGTLRPPVLAGPRPGPVMARVLPHRTVRVVPAPDAAGPARDPGAGTLGWFPSRRRHHVKIVVDYDECASNAVCMGIAPEVFEVRDDGFLYVLDEHPGEELREKVRQAANGCPTGAITIVEDE